MTCTKVLSWENFSTSISYLRLCILGQQGRNSWFECWLAEVLDLSISMWWNHLARGFLMQGQVMKWHLTTLNQLWQIYNTSGHLMRESVMREVYPILLHTTSGTGLWYVNWVARQFLIWLEWRSTECILTSRSWKGRWQSTALHVDLCLDIRLKMCCWVACTHLQPEFREDWQALNAAVF